MKSDVFSYPLSVIDCLYLRITDNIWLEIASKKGGEQGEKCSHGRIAAGSATPSRHFYLHYRQGCQRDGARRTKGGVKCDPGGRERLGRFSFLHQMR